MGAGASAKHLPLDYINKEKAKAYAGEYFNEDLFNKHATESGIINRSDWDKLAAPILEKNFTELKATQKASVLFNRASELFGDQGYLSFKTLEVFFGNEDQLGMYLIDQLEQRHSTGMCDSNQWLDCVFYELTSKKLLPFLGNEPLLEADLTFSIENACECAQIAKAAEVIFNQIDADGDKVITKEELEQFMSCFDAMIVIKEMDQYLATSNFNENIELIEFVAYFLGYRHLGMPQLWEFMGEWGKMVAEKKFQLEKGLIDFDPDEENDGDTIAVADGA